MTFIAFELVKKVLQMREAEALAVHGKNLDEVVGQIHKELGSKYSQLSWAKKPIIDYSDPATHLAYL